MNGKKTAKKKVSLIIGQGFSSESQMLEIIFMLQSPASLRPFVKAFASLKTSRESSQIQH